MNTSIGSNDATLKLHKTTLLSNEDITIFAYDDLKLGQIIKDQGLLKLILKALKWDSSPGRLYEQLERLKVSNFQEVLSNPHLLRDEDMMQLLGPYTNREPSLSITRQLTNSNSNDGLHLEDENNVTEMEVGVDPDLFFPYDDDETRSAEEIITLSRDDIKPILCMECPQIFNSEAELLEHNKLNHDTSIRLVDKRKIPAMFPTNIPPAPGPTVTGVIVSSLTMTSVTITRPTVTVSPVRISPIKIPSVKPSPLKVPNVKATSVKITNIKVPNVKAPNVAPKVAQKEVISVTPKEVPKVVTNTAPKVVVTVVPKEIVDVSSLNTISKQPSLQPSLTVTAIPASKPVTDSQVSQVLSPPVPVVIPVTTITPPPVTTPIPAPKVAVVSSARIKKRKRLAMDRNESAKITRTLSEKASAKRTRKKPTTSRFACNQCGKKLSTKGNLKVHQYTHKPKGKFTCDKCGRM